MVIGNVRDDDDDDEKVIPLHERFMYIQAYRNREDRRGIYVCVECRLGVGNFQERSFFFDRY